MNCFTSKVIKKPTKVILCVSYSKLKDLRDITVRRFLVFVFILCLNSKNKKVTTKICRGHAQRGLAQDTHCRSPLAGIR